MAVPTFENATPGPHALFVEYYDQTGNGRTLPWGTVTPLPKEYYPDMDSTGVGQTQNAILSLSLAEKGAWSTVVALLRACKATPEAGGQTCQQAEGHQ